VKNNKNFDGIRKLGNVGQSQGRKFRKPRILKVDSIVRRPVKKNAVKSGSGFKTAEQTGKVSFFRQIYSQKKVPVAVAVLALIMAFIGGMWSVFDTSSSMADAQPQVLGESTSQPNLTPSPPSNPLIAGAELQGQNSSSVSNDVLFNTPIEYLQNYFKSASEPDTINRRKNQIERFLADRHSPLTPASETIAEQEHWKLILAIAFAESTLGKNCADNNCSNIGVKPGAPSWRTYSSYSAWVVDFNRLLDKRYNDWTLDQMCGVYVQPCNPNWLLATRQILDALKENNIE